MIINAKHLENSAKKCYSKHIHIFQKLNQNVYITVQHYVWNVCLHEMQPPLLETL